MKRSLNRFFYKYRYLHLLALPGVLFYLIFRYMPMYGVLIAFKDFRGIGGFWGIFSAEWAGVEHFKRFFDSIYFFRLLSNTLIISTYRLIFGFPLPILLALMLNEVRFSRFKRVAQTITYMPHFLTWVVVAGLLTSLLSPSAGPVNELFRMFGLKEIFFLSDRKYFRAILVLSDIWKNLGWGSIIYLAAIAGIDVQLYEAAVIEGANRFQRIRFITLPCIREVIAILLILNIGRIMSENFEQILNLYNESVYEVSDVFETYVYRMGIVNGQFAYTAAVNLFKSVVSLFLVIGTNRIAKKLGSEGLW